MWEQFSRDRNINVEFYRRVPEDKLDFRMVDTPHRRSDCPRESLTHQIYVTRNYIYSVRNGTSEWSNRRYKTIMVVDMHAWSKQQLLEELEKTTSEVAMLLAEKETAHRTIRVPWAKEPVPAMTFLWGLDSHEILHQGWNLAIMDHLGIERFPALKAMWG